MRSMNLASYYESASAPAVPVPCAPSSLLVVQILVATSLPPSSHSASEILQYCNGSHTKDRFHHAPDLRISRQKQLDDNLSQL